MNKHRKAESRRVKSYVRILRAHGFDPSYKDARRHIRKRDRAMRDLPKNVNRGLRKGIKRLDHDVSSAFASIVEYATIIGRMHRAPIGISAVAESLALLNDESVKQKLSEDEPRRQFRSTNYVFLDEYTPMKESPALWPKENPHIPKEVSHD